jgi:hypothetical protein
MCGAHVGTIDASELRGLLEDALREEATIELTSDEIVRVL